MKTVTWKLYREGIYCHTIIFVDGQVIKRYRDHKRNYGVAYWNGLARSEEDAIINDIMSDIIPAWLKGVLIKEGLLCDVV